MMDVETPQLTETRIRVQQVEYVNPNGRIYVKLTRFRCIDCKAHGVERTSGFKAGGPFNGDYDPENITFRCQKCHETNSVVHDTKTGKAMKGKQYLDTINSVARKGDTTE